MMLKEDVRRFLEEIKVKESSGVLAIVFLNEREKNAQALLDLDIPPDKRTEIIRKLDAEDFYRLEEGKYLDRYDMLSFGKMIKEIEVYIKISITERNAICISFHQAEQPITYPFKKHAK